MIMKKIYLSLIAIAALTLTACGGGNKSNDAEAEADEQQTEESVSAEQSKAAAEKTEQKAEAKKWYEGDFTLEKGVFADIRRPLDGGKGLDGVTVKSDRYFNPFIEEMRKEARA